MKWKLNDLDLEFLILPSFSHIISGGYSAGYYAYKWAEVLSTDAFYGLKESGDTYLEQIDMANKFKEIILKRGGSTDMIDNFIEYRGREPNVEYLLKEYQIIE